MWTDARLERLREAEIWIAWWRLAGLVFAILEVGVFSIGYPPGYETAAWITTAAFGVGTVALLRLSRIERRRAILALGVAALLFDTLVICAYSTIYAYEYGSPTRWVLILAVAEAALRYGAWGGAGLGVLLIPFFVFVEAWRANRFGPPGFVSDRVSFPAGVMILAGVIVGRLVDRLDRKAGEARGRAAEAEQLRDEIGRRVDVLEAANRCARALGSSLDLDQAFNAFIRELRGLVPFTRTAIVLVENDAAHVIATAGESADEVMPPGALLPLERNVLADVVARAQTIYRADMREPAYDEETTLLEIGVQCRVAAPLLVGARAIGIITVGRGEPNAFSAHEIELMSLLGRLAGSAVQNMRAYEAERRTVDELRRLSTLRADFVSLVSHELRSPMAAVIGAARTLQMRWRDLTPEQRDAFLALIADETDRLADLIGDVLDTSRIDAGTFTYTFDDVDIAALVHEAVGTASIGQDDVAVVARVPHALPAVRGDANRLRQVLTNLIDNAIKYSPDGETVEVRATALNGAVLVDVVDRGTGIAPEDQRVIFEKFGRVGGATKPGTGLGLYIARSIAEAHGGSISVSSAAGRGATFTLKLPIS